MRRRARKGRTRRPRRHISIAFVTGVTLVPLVVATGFLTEDAPSASIAPGIASANLRGSLDRADRGRVDLRGPLPL